MARRCLLWSSAFAVDLASKSDTKSALAEGTMARAIAAAAIPAT